MCYFDLAEKGFIFDLTSSDAMSRSHIFRNVKALAKEFFINRYIMIIVTKQLRHRQSNRSASNENGHKVIG